MKGDFFILLATAVVVLVIPLAVTASSGVGGVGDVTVQPVVRQSSAASSGWQATGIASGLPSSVSENPAKPQSLESSQSVAEHAWSVGAELPKELKILNRTTGKVDTLPLRDYVRGAIAAEMPASFHLEALKAQGVAALTYALYHHREQQQSPDELLDGADFSADPANRQGYMTERDAKAFYGENRQYNWNKVCTAADEAMKWVLTYEGEPIAAAYHAISSGNTEAAENIWQRAMPCLRSVDSSWDMLANGYRSSVTVTQAGLEELLEQQGIRLPTSPANWITIMETSAAGYVTSVRVGDTEMSGNELRNLLGLRSSCFTVERQGKNFIFEVCGYGHGAGLSQNGADYMARQGSDFKEILLHYYKGARLTEIA